MERTHGRHQSSHQLSSFLLPDRSVRFHALPKLLKHWWVQRGQRSIPRSHTNMNNIPRLVFFCARVRSQWRNAIQSTRLSSYTEATIDPTATSPPCSSIECHPQPSKVKKAIPFVAIQTTLHSSSQPNPPIASLFPSIETNKQKRNKTMANTHLSMNPLLSTRIILVRNASFPRCGFHGCNGCLHR